MFQSLGRDSVHSSISSAISSNLASSCFNPSVGILFIQARVAIRWRGGQYAVSIPRSGFCSFKRDSYRWYPYGLSSFNPSVGILFIQAPKTRIKKLGIAGFNPSVGILFIQAHLFYNFQTVQYSFNPSVGILFIQARPSRQARFSVKRFQSLGRDSVHSSLEAWQ